MTQICQLTPYFDATWLTSDIQFHYQGGTYAESSPWRFTLDGNNNTVFQREDAEGGGGSIDTYTYNLNGVLVSYNYQGWSPDPGGGETTSTAQYIWSHVGTGTEPDTAVPTINLSAFPNTFRNSTILSFELEKAGLTNLSIYNLKGQKVRTLQSGLLAKGIHTLTWNGKDDIGKPVSSGIYLFRLECGHTSTVTKGILLK